MSGFSNEFLKTLSVTRRGRTRVITCRKCGYVLAEQIVGEAVDPTMHNQWLRHAKACDGTPPGERDVAEEKKKTLKQRLGLDKRE